jgi:hypothetical protein
MRKPTPVSSSADGPSSGESSSTPELRQTESGNWTPTAQFYLALRYLDKAKARYPPDKSDTYDQFLEIMQAYRKGRDSLSEDSRGYRRGEKRMFEHVRIIFPIRKEFLQEALIPHVLGFCSSASTLQR